MECGLHLVTLIDFGRVRDKLNRSLAESGRVKQTTCSWHCWLIKGLPSGDINHYMICVLILRASMYLKLKGEAKPMNIYSYRMYGIEETPLAACVYDSILFLRGKCSVRKELVKVPCSKRLLHKISQRLAWKRQRHVLECSPPSSQLTNRSPKLTLFRQD